MEKILGIITARGGSKGIPGKNIKMLCGKPLLAYTIAAAQKSGVFDRLILSTDDPHIAAVAKEYGCDVPFLRPKELARDETPHLPVVQHAVSWLRDNENYNPDYVMILQPTSPLRQAFHIREAVDLMRKTRADSVLSVSEIPEHFHPANAMVTNKDHLLQLFDGRPVYDRISQRQKRSITYWSIGSIYLFKTELLFDEKKPNIYGERVAPYIIDNKYVIDINTPEDWEKAEEAIKELKIEI